MTPTGGEVACTGPSVHVLPRLMTTATQTPVRYRTVLRCCCHEARFEGEALLRSALRFRLRRSGPCVARLRHSQLFAALRISIAIPRTEMPQIALAGCNPRIPDKLQVYKPLDDLALPQSANFPLEELHLIFLMAK